MRTKQGSTGISDKRDLEKPSESMESDSEASSATGRSSPLVLAIGAAVASVACIAVIGIGGLLSYGKGTDWSVSLLSLIARNGVWLLVFAGIAWMCTIALN